MAYYTVNEAFLCHNRRIMRLIDTLTDDAALRELGQRLMSIRLEQNLTQSALAEKAGVGLHSLQRLESGEAATRLSGFLRILRALNQLDRLEAAFPEAQTSPLALMHMHGRKRQRASRAKGADQPSAPSTWTWEK